MPRWVTVSGIVVLLLALLAVVVLLIGGGEHDGPSRHFGAAGDPMPPASAPFSPIR
jgi:hypothetical protein